MSEETDEQEQIREVMRILGKRKSEKKTAAVRENAKKGGRKPGTPVSEEQKAKQSEAMRARWADRKRQKEGSAE